MSAGETVSMDSQGSGAKVKVDGEEAVLHITDQSVMFEKSGRVNGFERSAIRMVKPDGEAMIIAYSVGSEVKSVRIEPTTAVAALLVFEPAPGQSKATELDEVFEKLYWSTRTELEERLAKVEAEPNNKKLRLTPEERQRCIAQRNQMIQLAAAELGVEPESDQFLLTFRGLDKQTRQWQSLVVKILHIQFLLGLVSLNAESADIAYETWQAWPEDWSIILERFGLDNSQYRTELFASYVGYLRPYWNHFPKGPKPVLVGA